MQNFTFCAMKFSVIGFSFVHEDLSFGTNNWKVEDEMTQCFYVRATSTTRIKFILKAKFKLMFRQVTQPQQGPLLPLCCKYCTD